MIELSGKPFDIETVDVKRLTEASKASMINNIFVLPSEKTLQILFLN